jgi:hypothetical protein
MRAIWNRYAGVRAHCTMTVRSSQQPVFEDGVYLVGNPCVGVSVHPDTRGWGSNVPRALESRGLVDERMRVYRSRILTALHCGPDYGNRAVSGMRSSV